MATKLEWATGFARQAGADLEAYFWLQRNSQAPQCHRLQFLQMACEKLVKAHLCKSGSDPQSLQSSHAVVANTLPIIIKQQSALSGIKTQNASWIMKHARLLCDEIEMLAPAVKRGGLRPDNCEYPWEGAGGELKVPLDWNFKPSKLLLMPAGRTFLSLVFQAIQRLRK